MKGSPAVERVVLTIDIDITYIYGLNKGLNSDQLIYRFELDEASDWRFTRKAFHQHELGSDQISSIEIRLVFSESRFKKIEGSYFVVCSTLGDRPNYVRPCNEEVSR